MAIGHSITQGGGEIEFANIQYAVFEASTTWTVPAGVTKIDAFLVQGGQGGGHVRDVYEPNYGAPLAQGGKGGDRKTYKKIKVTPGTVLAITIGAGGSFNDGGTTGNLGGHSTIANTSSGVLTSSGGITGSAKNTSSRIRMFDDMPLMRMPIASGGGDGGNELASPYLRVAPILGGMGAKHGTTQRSGGALYGLQTFAGYATDGSFTAGYLDKYGYGCGGGGTNAPHTYTNMTGSDGTPGIAIIRYYQE